MRQLVILMTCLCLCLAIIWGASENSAKRCAISPASNRSPYLSTEREYLEYPSAVCFAPGTTEDYMAEWEAKIHARSSLDFNIGDRWGTTATDGNTGSQGDRIHLTYSFVPDGTGVDGSPSILFQRMNALFGSPDVWQPIIAQVFARWSEVSGIIYTQVSDDGASWPNASGVLGLRGDVRIGMANIDGPSNTLAYNYFPDRGDMLLDASEDWNGSSGNYIFLRNIVAHEHGHGWGLEHVCPVNTTKLLEPFYTGNFDGPQHDDIRAVQRNYGDFYEPNEDASQAYNIGLLSQNFTLDEVSSDDDSDTDFWKFSIPAGKGFTLTLIPDGYQYLDGTQNGDGSCSAGTMINSRDDQNLNLYLYDASGSTLRAQSANQPAGDNEVIYRYQASQNGDSFIVKVLPGSQNVVQLYKLRFELFNLADPYFSSYPIDFDSTYVNSPVTENTQVVNNANVQLNINSISVTAGFTVSPNTPQILQVGQALTLQVTYSAETAGRTNGVLTVTHSGPGQQLTCDLTGFATISALEFRNGTNFNFGEVDRFHTDSVGVLVRATGNIPLIIQSLSTDAPFSIGQTLPYSLSPSQILILRPRFTPTAEGNFTGSLIITHSAPSSPDTVYLSGTGIISSSVDPIGIATDYELNQNYPNPFNPTTTISFSVKNTGFINLQVFDIEGRLVETLMDKSLTSGQYSVLFNGTDISSGIYFYRLITPEFSDMKKMILVK